jgi:putative ABC transport system permease protein
MNLWLGLLIGLKEIWAHKFRSFLTMLGIILGVASLLSMFSLTAGMARGFRDFMTQVGGLELVSVINQEVPPRQEFIWEISPGRTITDAEAIRTAHGLINYVSPVLDIPGNLVAGAENFSTLVQGAWPDYIPINNHVVEFGRTLTWLDVEQAHHVCLVGSAVVEDLWFGRPHNECVGEKILINQRPFTIVGVFQLYEREEDKRRRELGLKPVHVCQSSPSRRHRRWRTIRSARA